MPTIFQLQDDMLALEDILTEHQEAVFNPSTGELLDTEEAKTVQRFMDELQLGIEGKADRYGLLIQELQARAKARREEADRLAKRARIDEGNVEWLKGTLKMVMERCNLKRVETEHFRFSVANCGGVLPLILDEASVAPEFLVIPEPVIDKKGIREALDRGKTFGWAHYGPRGTTLRIS